MGAAALAWLGGGLFVSWRVNRFPRHMRRAFTFTPWELQVPHRTVGFVARDGVRLSAWYLPPESSDAPRVIVLHGYRGNRAEVLGIGSHLWRSGFGVLLPDFRGRGGSERRRISMGAWEATDLAAAIEWMEGEAPDVPVGLLGYSMGGSVALMEGGRHKLVRAIAADCAYATQAGVLSYGVQRLIRLRGDFLLPAAALFHRGYRRPGFGEVTPIAHAAEWRGRALFFIGAGGDRTVAPSDARRLFDVAPEPKLLWVPPRLPHCGAYFDDRDKYGRLVAQFFDHFLRGERT
ncbi:MAG: alpha/beta fold hydrolase [Gemmatimonadetes bacterium]|nr:alpha/beta fold hydrolase [Gemmatimonadota bacterium]